MISAEKSQEWGQALSEYTSTKPGMHLKVRKAVIEATRNGAETNADLPEFVRTELQLEG